MSQSAHEETLRPAAAASQSFSSSRFSRASFSFLSFFLSFLSSCGERARGRGGEGFGVRLRSRDLSYFSRLEPARFERARGRRGTDARAPPPRGDASGWEGIVSAPCSSSSSSSCRVRRTGSPSRGAHRARRGLLTSVGADGKRWRGRSLVARRRVEGFGSRRGDATVVTPAARSTSGAWRADGPRGVSAPVV